ncbi:MAG TPA: nucleotide disphospho-sugar-binding domain-containing protein [Solirubrobacteraceae bacterium]|nr:nucleotide disphospho-sugar-binding domain-containing protein [Solirubrobacteraceae bacterium]
MRIFQTLIAFSGNAPPQLAVTRELVDRGHEVWVLAHRAARERIERTGAKFVEFRRAFPDMDITRRETDTLRDWEPRTTVGYVRVMLKDVMFAFVEDVARDCLELLEDWPAEVVVFDWMLIGAAIAAERAGLPAVTLVHGPYTLPVDGAPPIGFLGLRPMPGPLGALRDRFLGSAVTRILAGTGQPIINRARVEQGLAPLGDWEDQLLGVQAIYMMTAAELDFASRGRLPANVHYVGPAFEPYTHEWESPWPQTNTDPLVLISFSTSYMNQRALVQRVLDAVGGLPVRALLTAGPALEVDQLRIPANTRTVAFVPHRSVLPHAALVVTHAGWQTINAALSDSVPLVCVPDGRDQPDNAARVVAAGAGVRVRKKASPRKLRRVIAEALQDPALKRGAERMAEALSRSDGAVAVAEAVERLGTPESIPAQR